MSNKRNIARNLFVLSITLLSLSGCFSKDDDDYKALALAASSQADVSIAVTGVTLPLTERLLADATSFTLVADVQPADATNPQITWESSDATVAEVDANGLVTAKNLGEATITARTVDGGFSATCKIKVVPMLVIATAGLTDSVDKALTDLGCTFDEVYSYSDWTSGIDFSAYDMVMVGMDGGAVSAESIQKIRTDVVDQGRRVFFIGGSAWQPFVEGVNQYLVACDTTNYF